MIDKRYEFNAFINHNL